MSNSGKAPPEPLPPFGGHAQWPAPEGGTSPRIPPPWAWRTQISSTDFEEAENFIAAAEKHDEASLEYKALLEVAVIRYARPFSDNEKDPKNSGADSRLGLDPEKVLSVREDFELHKRLVGLRNKVVAHAEAERNPVSLLGNPAPGRSPAIVSRPWHITQEKLDLEAFARITRAMRDSCFYLLSTLR
jgi:hypothetical protein